MDKIKGIGKFLVGFVCVWFTLMFIISKFTHIGRVLGITILVISFLAGITSVFYKDDEEINS